MELAELLNRYAMEANEDYKAWIQSAAYQEDKLEEVWAYAFGGTERERKRACWILHHVSDLNPTCFENWQGPLLQGLQEAKTDAEERFVLRYYSMYALPEDEEVESYLLDYCMERMLSSSQAAAPRIYSVTVLEKLTLRYPELAHEVAQAMELALENATAGMRVRVRNAFEAFRRAGLL